MSLVERGEEEGVDVPVRLLHLVEEEDAVGLSPHRLGECAALVVAHIARRRAHETAHGVALRILRHVDAGDGVLGIKELLREGLAELRLAHASRPKEEEGAEGPALVVEARAGHAHRVRDALDRPGLADHARRERALEIDELVSLAPEDAVHGDLGGPRDHLGHRLCRHLVREEACERARGVVLLLQPRRPLLQLRDDRVPQLARRTQVTVALGLLKAAARLLELELRLLLRLHRRPLA
mmetsp:Transcript_23086/g.72117  ORF Transcript_23086/g.72117 Transcript_23086/m.72117 type:complete len:239 (-) Transcript_23086:71-787(-)